MTYLVNAYSNLVMIQINQIKKGGKMNQYLITNSKDIRDHFEKNFPNTEEARHWIINHLDLSKKWKLKTKQQHEKNIFIDFNNQRLFILGLFR